VREVAVVYSTRVLAELLRRGANGHWPDKTEKIGQDESIEFACRMHESYAQTHLG
jgi:hypothetical protein